MTTTRPDAFGKMAQDAATDGWSGDAAAVGTKECAMLLRDYHENVVNAVKRQSDICGHQGPHNDSGNCVGYRRACNDILAALTDADERGRRGNVWPTITAPAMYENPAAGWEDTRVPDLVRIWELAREVGYAVGLHGSLKRDMDLIAAPWTDEAVGDADLIDHLCRGLSAVRIGGPDHKPHGRVAVTLQVDGYYKPIDLSILPRSKAIRAQAEGRGRMYQLIKETFPVARKTYKCIWCGEPIVIGEKHCHEISKFDELQDHRWHLECHRAATEYFLAGDGPEFSAHENDRPVEVRPPTNEAV